MNHLPGKGPILPWIFLIWALGLTFRLLYFFQCRECPIADLHYLLIDSEFYDLWAKSLAGGDWLGREAFFMGPLYPYCLGLAYKVMGADFIWIRLLQILAGSVTCVGVFWLGMRLFSVRIGLLAALLCNLYGLFYYYENLLLATSQLVFLTLVCAILLVEASLRNRGRWWLAAGLCLGLCSVSKANLLLAVPFVILWILDLNRDRLARKGLPMAALFAAGIFLMVAPVTVRNYAVQKDFVLLTANGGLNFYVGNNPEAEGVWMRCKMPFPGANIDSHLNALRTGGKAYQGRQPSEIGKLLAGEAWDFIRTSPGAFLALLGKKFMVSLNAFEVGNRDDYSFAQRFSWFLSLPLLGFGLLAPLGLLGALLSLRELRRYFVPLLFILVPFATMVLIFVLSRYRLPAVPFLCLFAARAIADLRGMIQDRGWIQLGAWIVALAGISAVVHWPFDRLDVKSWQGAANAAYAGHLAGMGLPDQALEEVELALSMNPDDPLSLNLHARLCLENGDLSRAEADYRHGMSRYPHDLRWVLQLAGILEQSGQKEALKLLYEETVVREERKAIAQGEAPPLLGAVYLGLGQLRLEKGNRTAAEKAFRKAVRYAPAHADAFHTLVLFLAADEASRGEALALAEQAAAANPTARALSLLGWVHFMAGHPEEAEALLEQALEKKPQNPLIQSRLKRVRQEGKTRRDH